MFFPQRPDLAWARAFAPPCMMRYAAQCLSLHGLWGSAALGRAARLAAASQGHVCVSLSSCCKATHSQASWQAAYISAGRRDAVGSAADACSGLVALRQASASPPRSLPLRRWRLLCVVSWRLVCKQSPVGAAGLLLCVGPPVRTHPPCSGPAKPCVYYQCVFVWWCLTAWQHVRAAHKAHACWLRVLLVRSQPNVVCRWFRSCFAQGCARVSVGRGVVRTRMQRHAQKPEPVWCYLYSGY